MFAGAQGATAPMALRGWKKVLRIDGPFRAQGFLSLTGPLAPRVVDCRSAAMLIKSALRDLLFCVIGHDWHSGD